MLLKVHREEGPKQIRLENMVITQFNELALFLQSIQPVEDAVSSAGTFIVTFNPPHGEVTATIEIPLVPELVDPEVVDVTMHQSPTKAYKMGEPYDSWFSSCLGYEVVLVYLGQNLRRVLGNLSPRSIDQRHHVTADTWLSSISNNILGINIFSFGMSKSKEDEGITFADCAPYLIITEESFNDAAKRFPAGSMLDITKFRPNIVLSGSNAAYEEDFWAQLLITNVTDVKQKKEQMGVELILTQNCVRCTSINVDYSTGKQGADESGKVLKKLTKDRRVDKGKKYSPVFGRYGFLKSAASPMKHITLGDEVVVVKRNTERTGFGKSQIAEILKD